MYEFSGTSLTVYYICLLAVYVLLVVAEWKIFTKAGEKGWKSIIPIYNMYILFKITWKKSMFWTSLVIAVIGGVFLGIYNTSGSLIWGVVALAFSIAELVIHILLNVKLSRAFGHGAGYAILLILFLTLWNSFLDLAEMCTSDHRNKALI